MDFLHEQEHNLLKTKRMMPCLPRQILVRKHLLDRLDLVRERRLALVCAPAGYGKTTLLLSWISRQRNLKVIWVSLDQEDNEPLRFWRTLLSALEISHLSIPLAQADQDRVIRFLLTRFLNDAVEKGDHTLLLLDDYHQIKNQSIHDEMHFMLEHLPPNLHVVLTTRGEPPLPLARLRLSQLLVEIRLEDLRLTQEEAAEFLRQVHNIELGEDELIALEKRSEGWIAALQLAALALHSRPEGSAFFGTLSGNQHMLFEYLVEEVLSGLPDEIQLFLLRTSILSRLCADVCQVLTGRDDAQEVLNQLVQANLFLVPLDEQGIWYRYHHLFAEVLVEHLRHLQTESIPDLHRQASRWYEQQGFIHEAFEHALSASDFARAGQVLTRAGEQMLLRGEMGTLRTWIERLPDALVHSSPSLIMAHYWTIVDAQHLMEAQRCLHEMEQVLRNANKLMAPASQVLLNSARSLYARFCKEFPQAILLLQQALEDVEPFDYQQRCYMLLHLSEYHWSLGDLSQAQQTVQESLKVSEAGGYAFFIATDQIYLSRMHVLGGRSSSATRISHRMLQFVKEDKGRMLSLSGMAHLELALLSYERNDLSLATQHHEACAQVSLWVGDRPTLVAASLLDACLRLALDDRSGARAALLDAEIQAEDFDTFFPLDGCIERFIRLHIALGEGETAALILAQLSDMRLPPLLQEDLQLACIRWQLPFPHPTPAPDTLQPLLSRARLQGRKVSIIRILLVQALAWYRQDSTDRALIPLSQALTLAEPIGLVRTFVDEGPPLRSLLLALDGTTIVSQDYIARLLAAFPPEQNTEAPEATPAHQPSVLHDPLSARELEILRLIAAGSSNQEIATRLVIALSTLKTHIHRMYAKLGVRSRTQALACARRLRLI